jgi:hypothetical protein
MTRLGRWVRFATILLVSCPRRVGSFEQYEEAVRNGRSDLAFVRSFAEVYPRAEEFIIHYGSSDGTTKWDSKVGLHGRYILTMQMPIRIQENFTHSVQTGDPAFHLVEVESFERLPTGASHCSYRNESERHFGLPAWSKLREAGGDLGALGMEVDRTHPVQGIDDVELLKVCG